MPDVYQLELESQSMDLHTGARPEDEVVPNSRMERWMEGAQMRGRWSWCQSGISDGKKDGCNRGRLLYSDRRS